MERMQREEPSVMEKTQTDPIVPNTDRGLEETSFTSIKELLTSMQPDPSDDTSPFGENVLMKQSRQLPEDLHISAPNPGSAARGDDVLCETSASGMFPLDGPAAFAEANKLSFLSKAMQISQTRHDDDAEPSAITVHTTGDQPFIRVERGADFADNLHEDFFPRTFPKLFPWGSGGPKALDRPGSSLHDASSYTQRSANHSLNYWTKYVLQRHGGRFATHPVFCFLVFNILLRSTNRRISMVRMARGSFERLDQVYGGLTADRLKRAQEEIRDTRTTTDADISFLLRELSIFGHAQPLSNETRLLMRRKIQALNIWTGMPAIWITINPNDINNPVKIKLSMHRLHEYDTAKELLADLRGRYNRIALSTMDPVSAAIFFHREISLFFKEYLEGNIELPSLIDDMAEPEEEEYRAQVVRYLDSVFNECLDEEARRAVRKERKPIDPIEEIMHDTEALTAAFDNESNYIAYCCQKIAESTGFTDDGLLRIQRNHPLVNRYNKAMAVGLRHNHDISMIKTKGLAMVFYITNYATKLDTPMWKRLVFAADVLRQLRESAALRGPSLAEQDAQRQGVVNEGRQFLMRAANRIFSERQLSAVETIFRRWPHLHRQAYIQTDAEEPSETVQFQQNGRTLLYLDAYAYRGPVLRDVCLYDYMSMITLERRRGRDEDEIRIALEGPPECHEWIQKLHLAPEYAVPVFQGFISDDHIDEHPVYFKRNSVLHLALFNFADTLCARLRLCVANISLLRRSAEDARKDARLWASRSEGDDTVDIEFPLDEGDDNDGPTTEEPTMAEHHQSYTALLRSLQNAMRDSDATKDSPVLRSLIQDFCQENPAEEGRPFIQRHENFYQQIRHHQDSVLAQCPIPSTEDVQAAAKAQDLLHIQMLNEIEGGVMQGDTASINYASIDDLLVRQCDTDIPIPRRLEDSEAQSPRMFVELGPVGGFMELGLRAASTYTLNSLQSMALQLICHMLGGATLFHANYRLQALRDYPDKPFGGIPVILLMGDFYQFAPVLKTSLLVDRIVDSAYTASLGQATITHHRGHSLWLMFKTVILLEEQVRARDDPQLGALLDRLRAGTQTREDFNLLNTRRHISIFISTHTWRSRALSQLEVAQTIKQGDNSSCKIPRVFFYAQGMPVIINKNTYTGLRVMNGAEFTAMDVIPDPKFPGYYLADNVTIHFGPPLGILLESQDTKDLAIPALPTGTVLIRPITHTLDPTNSHYSRNTATV
ncbi:hypothetical protein ACJ41O_014440 [Fusarium nematophilum]